MSLTEHATSIAEAAFEPQDALDIEFICDEDYKRNRVYCSWQDITSPEAVASTEAPVPGPVTPLHAPQSHEF